MADDHKEPTANPPPPKSGEPPASPGAVKKTPLKTPREIQLEKDVAKLQDRQDTLEAEIGGVKDFLEGLEIGGPKPVEIKPGKIVPAKTLPATRGFFNEVERDIWGEG